MSNGGVVGVGVIGTGFARTTQLPAFKACEGARVVAIASGHKENAEAAAREFDIPFVAGDWREVIARDDVDLVSIVTPPSTHAEMALAALDAGKAVLCEKPMAMDSRETDLMRRRAGDAGLLAHIDHELRFLPARRLMREMIRGGRIGRVRHAKFLYRADWGVSPQRRWNWWADAAAGGGLLGAIGSHAVDTLHWLLGSRVSHVSATLSTHVLELPAPGGHSRQVTTDDEANLLLHFSDGETTEKATGVVALSGVEPGRPEHRVEVFGSEGSLSLSGAGELLRAEPGGGDWQRVETEQAPLAEGMRDTEWSRGFTVFAREIVAALGEGRNAVEAAATFDDGHHIQLVLDAARAAHEGGCRVTVTQ
ncbi:MAG TPA: Gfo/Idh/MocA family oxidoreductase [Pyrinomonadaceae bacterium]|nr:Gfo/Idh/MocA family oxidoreductase [Pyrinomonadaceae bacterium]